MNGASGQTQSASAQAPAGPQDTATVEQPAPELPTSTSDAFEQISTTLFDTIHGISLDFVAHLPLLVAALVLLGFTWALVSILRRVTDNILDRTETRGSLRELFERVVVILTWGLGLMLAAMIVFPGLTPASALGGLGLLSVAIGFAFRDIFENFFAGILILWRFPFEQDDFIECQGIMGRVEDVSARMTELRRPTGELVVIPNGFLFKNPVEVLTHRGSRRAELVTGVAYGEDVASSIRIIEGAVESCASVAEDPGPEVFASGFGASSVDIDVIWWTDAKPLAMRRSRGEVITAIKAALDSEGVEIPFPYRTLTFDEPLKLISEPEGSATN